MTNSEQLNALEVHALTIDSDCLLIVNADDGWLYTENEDDLPGVQIGDTAALDIRTGQAMRWLMAWCDKQPLETHLSIDYGVDVDTDWLIVIWGYGRDRLQSVGPTFAHALAKAIEALKETGA